MMIEGMGGGELCVMKLAYTCYSGKVMKRKNLKFG